MGSDLDILVDGVPLWRVVGDSVCSGVRHGAAPGPGQQQPLRHQPGEGGPAQHVARAPAVVAHLGRDGALASSKIRLTVANI